MVHGAAVAPLPPGTSTSGPRFFPPPPKFVEEDELQREVLSLAPDPLDPYSWQSPFETPGPFGLRYIFNFINPLNRGMRNALTHLQAPSASDIENMFISYHAVGACYYTFVGGICLSIAISDEPPAALPDGSAGYWFWLVAHALYCVLAPMSLTLVGIFCLDSLALSSVRREDLRRFVLKHSKTFTWNRTHLGVLMWMLLNGGFFMSVFAKALAESHGASPSNKRWWAVFVAFLVATGLMTKSLLTTPAVFFDAARPWEQAYNNIEARHAAGTGEAQRTPPAEKVAAPGGGGGAAALSGGVEEMVALLREQNRLLETKLDAVAAKLDALSAARRTPEL
jgi:hypothetical protein